jgi:hypothetical protein
MGLPSGPSQCVVSAYSGSCYYSPGLSQLYGSSFQVTLVGFTCDQARVAYPPLGGESAPDTMQGNVTRVRVTCWLSPRAESEPGLTRQPTLRRDRARLCTASENGATAQAGGLPGREYTRRCFLSAEATYPSFPGFIERDETILLRPRRFSRSLDDAATSKIHIQHPRRGRCGSGSRMNSQNMAARHPVARLPASINHDLIQAAPCRKCYQLQRHGGEADNHECS